MDLLYKKKLKEMESKVFELSRRNEELCRENELLKKQLSGARVCGSHCSVCQNGIYTPVAFGISWKCKLDVLCKDFHSK